jgi:hypothetical protein
MIIQIIKVLSTEKGEWFSLCHSPFLMFLFVYIFVYFFEIY